MKTNETIKLIFLHINIFTKLLIFVVFALAVSNSLIQFSLVKSISTLSEITNKTQLGSNLFFITSFWLFLNILQIFSLRLQTVIAVRVGNEISTKSFMRLFSGGLKSKNSMRSAEVITLSETSIEYVVNMVVKPLIDFSYNFTIIIIFYVFALVFYGKIALVGFLIASFLLLVFQKIISQYFNKFGKLIHKSKKSKAILIEQLWQLMRHELLSYSFFGNLKKYKSIDYQARKYIQNIDFYSQIPKYILEISFLSIALFLQLFGYLTIIQATEYFAIFIFLYQKFLPSFSLVLRAYTKFSAFKGSVIEAINLKDGDEKQCFGEIKNQTKFQVKRNNKKLLRFEYNDDLNRISLNFEKPKLILIKGESGSGKSTMLDKLCGLIIDEKSSKYYFDNAQLNLKDESIKKFWRTKFRYLEQNPFLKEMILSKFVVEYEYELDKINDFEKNNIYFKKMKFCGFNNKTITEFENKMIQSSGLNFSGGELRRIAIASIISLKNNYIYIFDEPTSGLDEKSKKTIIKNIKRLSLDSVVIVATHELNFEWDEDEILQIRKN